MRVLRVRRGRIRWRTWSAWSGAYQSAPPSVGSATACRLPNGSPSWPCLSQVCTVLLVTPIASTTPRIVYVPTPYRRRSPVSPPRFDIWQAPALAQVPHRFGMKRLVIGRAIALGIQHRGNLCVRVLLGMSVANPGCHLVALAMLAVAHGVPRTHGRTRSRLPVDLEPHLAAQAFLIEEDLFDHKAEQMCAVGRGRRVRVQPCGTSSPMARMSYRSCGVMAVRWSRCQAVYSRSVASTARSFSSQWRSRVRATSRFSGSTVSYWRWARCAA